MLRVNGLYGHIRRNNAKSLALLGAFVLLFQLVAFALQLPTLVRNETYLAREDGLALGSLRTSRPGRRARCRPVRAAPAGAFLIDPEPRRDSPDVGAARGTQAAGLGVAPLRSWPGRGDEPRSVGRRALPVRSADIHATVHADTARARCSRHRRLLLAG